MVLRPSILGQIGSIPNDDDADVDNDPNDIVDNTTPFSRTSGKRVIKPSFKLKESNTRIKESTLTRHSNTGKIFNNENIIFRLLKFVLKENCRKFHP